MTMTTHDLRHAWNGAVRPAAAPDDPDAVDGLDNEAPADPPAGDGEDSAGGEEGDEGDEEAPEEIKDPAAKARSDEAKKYRLRARAERERADEAEGALQSARLELAFYRAALAHPLRINDVDAAYKLADLRAVSTDGDEAAGLGEAVEMVVQRYPHLTSEDPPSARHPGNEPLTPSGRVMNPPRQAEPTYNQAQLAKKFPALARRVGR